MHLLKLLRRFQVANADNRWDTARRGAAGAAGLAAGPALDAVSRKRVQLPDWRPGGDWKRKPEAKRQKKVWVRNSLTPVCRLCMPCRSARLNH